MDRDQRIVFVQSQIACMLVELEAMKAANADREARGLSLAYDEGAFLSLPDRYLVGHNAVIEYLQS